MGSFSLVLHLHETREGAGHLPEAKSLHMTTHATRGAPWMPSPISISPSLRRSEGGRPGSVHTRSATPSVATAAAAACAHAATSASEAPASAAAPATCGQWCTAQHAHCIHCHRHLPTRSPVGSERESRSTTPGATKARAPEQQQRGPALPKEATEGEQRCVCTFTAGLVTLCTKTVPARPRRPASPGASMATSSPTTTISTCGRRAR